MVDDAREGPPFAAWYLLGSIFDNPKAVCLTPSYVEGVLRQAGLDVERTEIMLPGITMLTKASKAPNKWAALLGAFSSAHMSEDGPEASVPASQPYVRSRG